MKDWLPILISSLALLFSVYAAYVKDLRRKSVVKFRETWDAHQTPSSIGSGMFGGFLEAVEKNLERTIFLLYIIDLTNYGDKESEEISIHISNLPSDLRIHESLFAEPPYLVWHPTTHKTPRIDDQKIVIAPLQAGSTISLRIYEPLDKERKEISFVMIPRVEKIYNGNKQVLSVTDVHKDLISIKDVQRKIQEEFDEIKSKNV